MRIRLAILCLGWLDEKIMRGNERTKDKELGGGAFGGMGSDEGPLSFAAPFLLRPPILVSRAFSFPFFFCSVSET
jgi:hypothetical protein